MSPEARAQDGNSEGSDEQDPVLKALTKEKQVAELQQAIAEAKRAALRAELPSETKGAQGTVTLGEGAGYYAEIMAYRTLAAAATRISDRLGDGHAKTILIFTLDSLPAQKFQLWQLIKARLDDFDKQFAALLDRTAKIERPDDVGRVETPAALLPAVTSFLGGIADIAAFFKTDVTLTSRKTALVEEALVAEVASALKGKGWTVIVPTLNNTTAGSLVKQLDALMSQRRTAKDRRRTLESMVAPHLESLARLRKDAEAQEARLKALEAATPRDQSAISKTKVKIETLHDDILKASNLEASWKRLTAEFDTLIASFDEYRKTLTEGSAGEKPSPIEALAVVDAIKASAQDADQLRLKIASQGSEIHVTKSVWSQGTISYVGGSVTVFYWNGGNDSFKGAGSIPLWEAASVKAKVGTQALNPSGPR